jgi:cell division protease FtsH
MNAGQSPENGNGSRSLNGWAYLLLGLLMAALYWQFSATGPGDGRTRYEIPYSTFKQLIDQGQVADVQLQGLAVGGTLGSERAIGPSGQLSAVFKTRLPVIGDDALLAALQQHGVEFTVREEAESGVGMAVLLSFAPWLLLLLFFYLLYQRSGRLMGGPGELKRFLESPARHAVVPDVRFSDVAGQVSAKREVAELVEFLKSPERFRRLGAEVPRGVLLMGPPGTGKTLLAKALAGEAGVPFFSISGSEFIEVFVGVGAARVRNLFEAAKKNAPSIVFVDELDSVGRTRGTGLGGGNDEREQTLNQILAELDGFAAHDDVIVLAATNRPDVLDPALLRPGRFDRHVALDLPGRADRLAVLQVHARRVPMADDVRLDEIAAATPGFSGADLKNLVNEAAMQAAREQREKVSRQDFDDARDKLLFGTVRTLAIQAEEKHRLAVHEAGHVLVAFHLPHADPVHKVSIIPRGQALGGTLQLPTDERHTLPEDYLRDRLAVMLGGRTAERALLASVSSGADDDIRQSTSLARAMVGRWGMSRELGPVDLRDSEAHPFLGREMAQPRQHSEYSAQMVDKAVRDLILAAEAKAWEIIRRYHAQLEALIAALEANESLEREAIERVLGTPRQWSDAGTRTGHGANA